MQQLSLPPLGRKSLLAMLAIASFYPLAVAPAAARAQSDTANNERVLPRVSLPLQVGFEDGATALYITPEVGVSPDAPASVIATAHQVATGFNANFIPTNFGSLPGSPAVDDIFSFTNFKQGNVLASAPHPAGPANTDTNYSPLWQISLVAWNSGRQPRVLKSQTDIENAVNAGDVTVTQTPIIVECSVIFTPSGGLLPGARLTRDGK